MLHFSIEDIYHKCGADSYDMWNKHIWYRQRIIALYYRFSWYFCYMKICTKYSLNIFWNIFFFYSPIFFSISNTLAMLNFCINTGISIFHTFTLFYLNLVGRNFFLLKIFQTYICMYVDKLFKNYVKKKLLFFCFPIFICIYYSLYKTNFLKSLFFFILSLFFVLLQYWWFFPSGKHLLICISNQNSLTCSSNILLELACQLINMAPNVSNIYIYRILFCAYTEL